MGNQNSQTQWLVLDPKEEIELISKHVASSSIWYPQSYIKTESKKDERLTELENSWSYYRFKMKQRTRNPQTEMKPSSKYFIIAEYHSNTKNNIIPEELRTNLLKNLSILSKDKSIKYDIRNLNGSKYLYPKTNKFGKHITNVSNNLKITKNETSKPYDPDEDMDIWNDYFYDSDNDFSDMNSVERKSNVNKVAIENNTALIHDLIDPNKNTMDHKLWIPTIFNCRLNNYKIESEIPNLDRIKYSNLYKNIQDIFFSGMKKSFENVLGRLLHSEEKIIIKCMEYQLHKPNDKYIGNLHREGMGENIIAIGLYYPMVSSEIKGGELELIVVVSDSNYYYSNGTKNYQLTINEGSMVVFSNECYHKLISIECDTKSIGKPLRRIVLGYFLVSPNAINVPAPNDNRLKQCVNLCYNCKYIIDYWWKNVFINNTSNVYANKDWMVDIVTKMMCGDVDYIYDKRDEMRSEKGKNETGPPKRRRMNFGCLEGGTPY